MSQAEQAQARYTWLRLKDVAEQLAVSTWAVRQLIAGKQLRAMNVGTGKRLEYRIKPDWVEEFQLRRTDG